MTDKLDVYILGDYRPGLPDGLAEFSYQNVTLLKDLFDFHFVEFRPFEEEDYFDEEEIDGVTIHAFGTFNVSRWNLSKIFTDWVAELPTENILFHINHIYNFNNYLVAKLLIKLKIRYLHTPHDSYVYSPEFKNTRPFLKRLYRNFFVHFVDKYVLDHASLVHALTNQCISNLRLVTKSPIMVVANQVHDIDMGFEMSVIEPKICFIGRNDFRQKGVDRVLKGFRLFKSDRAGRKAKLVLIGPSNPSAGRLRDELTRNLGLVYDNDVILAGKIPDAERNKILKESKAYIHLSRFEGFGLSLIQALSAYKPVIVSRQIPISDKVLEYRAGFVIDTPEDTVEALKRIFTFSDDEYRQMAINARSCYTDEFHPDVVRPRLIEMYETAAYGNK